MAGRDPHEAHRVATPLELLFDLTFVTAFSLASSQLAHALAEGHYAAAPDRLRLCQLRHLLGLDQFLLVLLGL